MMSFQDDSSSDGCCPDSDSVIGSNAESSHSDPHPNLQEDFISRVWYFEGTITFQMNASECIYVEMPDLEAMKRQFTTDYFRDPPVPVNCMEIGINFSKATRGGPFNCTFTAPIAGMIQAKPAAASTWFSWLRHVGITDDAIEALTNHDLHVSLQNRDTEWVTVAKVGRRRRFDLTMTAWSFTVTLDVHISGADDEDYLSIAKKAFEARLGLHTLPNYFRFMTVLADLRPLTSGAVGPVSMPIKGYIQCRRQVDLIVLKNWQPSFDYDVVPKGLASDADFLAKQDGLQNESSYMFEIYTTGKLGLNNAGRMDKAIRASA
jgi:hypothetical protein